MASKYKGYLYKFGNVVLPSSFIAQDSGNEQTPNQREEIEAYRDDHSRELHRITADGTITKFSIVIRELTDTELLALQTVMKNSLVDAKQRKYRVTYWNDENLRYEQGDFYIPDVTYIKKRATTKYIKYERFTMNFIGYSTSTEVSG